MKPRKKGNQYEIVYRCPGYEKPICERFETEEDAAFRIAQVKLGKKRKDLSMVLPTQSQESPRLPKVITLKQLLEEYVEIYGLNTWGDSSLSGHKTRIRHYILPYLGDRDIRTITTRDLDGYYDRLQFEKAVVQKGHPDEGKTIGFSVIQKIHALLRCAFDHAVKWQYLERNPADYATLPRHRSKSREVWTPEEAYQAVQLCDTQPLKLCMQLALGCSMRIGEILGLTWDCIDITPALMAENAAMLHVNKELKRCENSSLNALDAKGHLNILYAFPHQKSTPATTTLVLKPPKTESSVRDIFIPNQVAQAILDHKREQDEAKALLGPAYTDFHLVFTQSNGYPVEARYVAEQLKDFIREHNLRPVVFHSLRHSSVSMKLSMCGDIKAVQGDTGHSQANMVTDLYAHTNLKDRQKLAVMVNQNFFLCGAQETPVTNTSRTVRSNESPEIAQIVDLLESHSEMAAAMLSMLQCLQ